MKATLEKVAGGTQFCICGAAGPRITIYEARTMGFRRMKLAKQEKSTKRRLSSRAECELHASIPLPVFEFLCLFLVSYHTLHMAIYGQLRRNELLLLFVRMYVHRQPAFAGCLPHRLSTRYLARPASTRGVEVKYIHPAQQYDMQLGNRTRLFYHEKEPGAEFA